jgi:hypothetical protein
LSPDEIFKLLVQGSPVELLALIVITGALGYWDFRRVRVTLTAERDAWRVTAQDAVKVAERLTEIMETAKRGRR